MDLGVAGDWELASGCFAELRWLNPQLTKQIVIEFGMVMGGEMGAVCLL